MKKTTAIRLATYVAAIVFPSFGAMAGGDPPVPVPPLPIPLPPLPPIPPLPDPCVWIPSPVYEACKADIKCNTGPVGGVYCTLSNASFCNRVTDPQKVAEDTAKILIGAAVCQVVDKAGGTFVQSKTRYLVAQGAASCAVSSARLQPRGKDEFCGALDSLVDTFCRMPKQINTCPWKNF